MKVKFEYNKTKKMNYMYMYVFSKDSDQSGHQPSLIRLFTFGWIGSYLVTRS